MSQTKKLVYGIALLVLAIAGYLQYGLDRSEENPANVDTKKKEQSLPAVETKVSAFEEEVTDSAKERDESTAADSNEEDNTDNIPQNYENTDATDDEEVEDEAPSVERSRLIGGADVEWIEPKPKDPNDKFGQPPM